MADTDKIRLHRIAHVYYKYSTQEVDAARLFMTDFGFFESKRVGPRTYYRGYGSEPFVLCVEASAKTEFGGAAFAVDSLAELEKAARILPPESKPTDIYELTDAPGGGKCVTFYDPTDGFPTHLVYGQEKVEELDPKFPELKLNFVSSPILAAAVREGDDGMPEKQNRDTNQFQRFEKRPTPVHKLGHYGMCVTNFKKCYEFYTKYFNFYPSEVSSTQHTRPTTTTTHP
ncbi:glyoxalase family protein, partial [Diaporthe helianthi]